LEWSTNLGNSLRIVVVGAGAIGGWVGGRLALAGHTVTLVGRQRLADAIAAGRLRLRSPGAKDAIADVQVVTSVAAAAASGPFDLALFTVKTYDSQTAIAEMKAADLGQPLVLSLQNGVRSEEMLAKAFSRGRVVAGTLLNPISTPQAGIIVLEKWRGGIGLAPVTLGNPVERWVQLFGDAVLPTRAYADHRAMKWSKLVLNLIGNASAAILDVSTTQVFADPRLFRLEVEMLREAVAVMRSLGLKPVGLPGYPVPLLAWGVRQAPLWVLRPILRKLVAGGRGEKLPSLLLELRRGRQRSEVADLNGAVVRAGAQLGLPTPVNRALAETLARLVEGKIEWDNVRHQPGVLLAVAAELQRKAKRARVQLRSNWR
jgi:2-dehydropantoate 2-reductase